jgi:hypothetical protein
VVVDGPAGLSPLWLTEALRRAGVLDNAKVTHVEATPVGTGQLASSLRLELFYDRPTISPLTVVAKLPSGDAGSREIARTLRSYEIEVRFYQELAPTLPVRTPACYAAELEADSGRFALLLEDMAPARQGDQLAGCTVEEAGRALDELVGLHAPRWGDPTLADLEWLNRQGDGAFVLEMLPALWSGFRQRFAERLGADVHEAGDALFPHLERYLDDVGPSTVVHRDFRLDNLLFRNGPSGPPVTVVDWQTCALGPALTDVAYFLGAGLLTDVRREHEADLVRRYHAGLAEAGVRDYDAETCWSAYRHGTWAGLITAVSAAMLVEQTERGDAMFLAMAQRHARHALDLDAPALLSR